MQTNLLLHASTKENLTNFIDSPSHAVLLTGSLGLGKTVLARSLSANLLHANEDSLINHAYYREVIPAKGTIAIETIRELSNFFRLKVPNTEQINRVAVIQDADTMGREAQNALLKLLEEPPEASLLILTSSQSERLLPTIRSRTQTIAVQTPDTAAVTAYFMEQGHTAAAIAHGSLLSAGNMARLTEILADGIPTESDALQAVKKALGGTTYERLLLVDGLAKQKDAAREFVATLLQVASASSQSAAAKQSQTLLRWHNVLQASVVAQDALERNGNTKLVLTDLLLSL